MQPGAARLGAGIEASRRRDRSMSQHATHDLVMAGPRIKEDLATGVTEQMRIEPQARVTEHRSADLSR